MSRRSLYRQSGRYTSAPYVTEIDDRVVSWNREWVSPILPTVDANGTPLVVSQSATPAPGVSSDSIATNGKTVATFSVKTWVQTSEKVGAASNRDCDDDDYLVLASAVVNVQPVVERASDGGLSAADIRGAVGGEAIPGISASSDYSKPEENKTETPIAPEKGPADADTATATAPAPGSAPDLEPKQEDAPIEPAAPQPDIEMADVPPS